MSSGRCPLNCKCDHTLSRRQFIRNSASVVAGSALLQGCTRLMNEPMVTQNPIGACGPASKYVPTIKAAFVRRKGEYGMRWPGAVYDGKAARKMYTDKITDTARKLGANLDLRSEPIYSLAEAEGWISQAQTANIDGLILVMLDRQEHSWPSATRVAQSEIPSIIYSPLGSSFTTNTIKLAETPGCVIY